MQLPVGLREMFVYNKSSIGLNLIQNCSYTCGILTNIFCFVRLKNREDFLVTQINNLSKIVRKVVSSDINIICLYRVSQIV